MPLVSGFSRGYPVSPALLFQPARYLPHSSSWALKTSLLRFEVREINSIPCRFARDAVVLYPSVYFRFQDLQEWSGEIWAALNIEVLRADMGEARSRGTKIKIYKTSIRPIVPYGSETCTRMADRDKIDIFEIRKVIRRTVGPIDDKAEWKQDERISVQCNGRMQNHERVEKQAGEMGWSCDNA
ncbi:hypothetical protein PR048_007976 [Dryococelus australis]|uniref:Uncharacterized protein n=1 Tax=Dryococelus australis TaxID=614101 RepID=A0ABQ9HVY7_9NEOP|nr:hypothetical protein PR048_007976 [Dryococelus australis]